MLTTSNASSLIAQELSDGILTITLQRPDKLNTFDMEMLEAFGRAVETARDDDGVRAVIIKGSGRAFCAGMDITIFQTIRELGLMQPRVRTLFQKIQRVLVENLELLEKPIICAIHGACTGAGLELAMACDVRIAARDARLSLAEVRLGVLPDSGGCHRLARLIGIGRAKEIVMTGRFVDAVQAERIGLVNRLVDANALDQAAIEFAKEFTTVGPLAIGVAKRVIDGAYGLSPRAGLELEYLAGHALYWTEDADEASRAFLEKRAPIYRGS